MEKNKTSFLHIFSYSLGDGAFSLTMNTIWGFAMFFYTQALGINAGIAGLILAVPMLWDAFTDPMMGYITDSTKSRFGRRHPHILIGGVLLALCYSFLWYVPDAFQSSQATMITYLIAVNLISRTLFTWFYVPYIALGFEVCPDYDQQSKLQGARFAMNMLFNIIFCGTIVWRVFLVNEQGETDTTIQANYARMGLLFSVAILSLILAMVFLTKKFAVDSRQSEDTGAKGFKGFAVEMVEILKDKNSFYVFLFYCVVQCSFVFVSSIQMYVYVSFMKLKSWEASGVHISGMVGFAIGALLAGVVSKKFDKKNTIFLGAGINILANVGLGVFFLTGLLKPHMMPIGDTSVASIVFWVLQASYWLGSGFLLPMIFSMVADVSEINRVKTGLKREGGYSAVLTFLMKVTSAIALVVVGKILVSVGFVAGSDVQTPEVSYSLLKMMVVLGVIFTALAAVCIIKYPINRKFMEDLRPEAE